ncbi:MAG: hypothetical protein WCJ03_02285 [Bacteroidales bacterium]
MKEFSAYEEELIKKLIEFDTNRDAWNNYIGIPVLDFLSDIFNKMWIYASIKNDKIVFEYSIKKYEEANYQKSLLDNQRRIIYFLHLLNKLMQNNYIIFVDLDKRSKDAVIQSLPVYGIARELKREKIAFDILAIQKSFGNCLYQAIIITEELRDLAQRDFKTIVQVRHETELSKIQEQLVKADIQIQKANASLKWTRWAFVVALIPALITCTEQINKWLKPKDTTIFDLKKSIEQKKIPEIIKVEVTNNPLITKPYKSKQTPTKKKI